VLAHFLPSAETPDSLKPSLLHRQKPLDDETLCERATVLPAHSWIASTMAEKPAVLIVGGLGYVGRFLALYIQQNNLASEVRIVDKVLPQLAWLAPEFAEACSQDKFMQADASKERKFSGPFLLISLIVLYLATAHQDHELTPTVYSIPRPHFRSVERQAVGLCFQLWRRDEIFPRR
jgi:hypothetical protein